MPAHYLKTIQPYFEEVHRGTKTFEFRKNDRNFKGGDEIYLQEYDAENKTYSGRQVRGIIRYLLQDFPGISEGYCIFSFSVTQLIISAPQTNK